MTKIIKNEFGKLKNGATVSAFTHFKRKGV